MEWLTIRRVLQVLPAVALLVALGGCCQGGAKINSPANNSTVSSPVTVGVELQQPTNSLTITLDGTDVTSQFKPPSPPIPKTDLIASFTLAAGAHKLLAKSFGKAAGSSCQVIHPIEFTVSGPPPPSPGSISLSLSASNLVLPRGKSASVSVTVSRTAPFAGDIDVKVTNLPAGVTQNSLKILTGQTTGQLTLTAGAAAQFKQTPLSVQATGIVPSGQQPPAPATAQLNLIVSRETGAFTEANPTPYASVPATKNSLSGAFSVDITPGAPLPQQFKAQFRKATVSVGQPVGFNPGNTGLGGAGFCVDNVSSVPLTRGVVLGSGAPAFSADYVFSFVDVNAPTVLRQTPVNGTTAFPPRVFFSPDCTLAMVVGSPNAGATKNVLAVIDLLTGNPLPNSGVQFNSAFSASVMIVNNQAVVKVITDTLPAGIDMSIP